MREEAKLSRRGFLKAALAAGTSAAAVGLVGCSPKESEGNDVTPMEGVENIEWEKTADVVVVGFGAAGSAATIEATKAGARVILLEKTGDGGGATNMSAGIIYMGGGTALQKQLGFNDTRDNMYNYLIAAAGDNPFEEMIGIYCDNSVDLFDWCLEVGMTFDEEFAPGKYVVTPEGTGLQWSGNERNVEYSSRANPSPRGHTPGTNGQAIFEPLKTTVETSGAEVIYQAEMTELIQDENGRVIGVRATIDGDDSYIKAERGVVLSSGGWVHNDEMLKTYLPKYFTAANRIGGLEDYGSGIKAAQKIGADLRNMGGGMCSVPVYAYGEAITSCILVNRYGRRVAAEDCYASWTGKAVIPEKGIAWVIADSKSTENVFDPFIGRTAEPYATSDTIEGLAEAIGIAPTVLANTVSLYNSMVNAGEDIEFHKSAEYLATIDAPPYAVYDFNISLTASFLPLGGLKINGNAQVISAKGEQPIPGLYAAGRTSCGIYGEYMGSGTSIGESLTFGRIAGRHAANVS
jgi:3-oxo-5alpha-steroid 4-dehydrogenase